LAQLGIEAAEAGEELAGQLTARRGDRIRGADLPEEAGGLPGADLLADAAGHQRRGTAGSRQQAWLRNRARSRCRFAQTFRTAWSSAGTGRGAGDRSAAAATDKASFGSFLPVSPDCRSRTRAARLAGTSTTRSPAATSWRASRHPS